LPEAGTERPYRLKYRFYYGLPDGTCGVRILTPRRFELLKQLRQTGPTSIRALSKALGRDYKNVHADVVELLQIGLIERTDEGLVQVPWDEIDAHLRLAA
jgi:predicted transcriptional regulator